MNADPPMVIMRPIRLEDLDQLVELIKDAGFGLTTLPKDAKLLKRRILDSLGGFERLHDNPRKDETFLFAMEDLKTGRIVGVSGILSKIGGFEPFYAYRIETTHHHSETLNVHKEVRALHLISEHNGPSEIGSLFLSPKYRKAGNGRLLSLVRLLFVAEYPERFDENVIAEMRGVIDDHGRSPFWDAIGKHFFEIDFPTANYHSAVDKRFIADLMPKHPIYIPMLPAEAQEVVGRVHPHTEPAKRMLEQEGFRFSGMVDIFEAGPVLTCPRDMIRTVRESTAGVLADITTERIESEEHILAKVDGEFRATRGPVEMLDGEKFRIEYDDALAIGVKVGERMRVATLRPKVKEPPRK